MCSSRIFFIHNPKAGGSSLTQTLCNNLFQGQKIAPVFSNSPNEHRRKKDRWVDYRGYDLYAGHLGYETYLALRDGHRLITNFREPVQRIYSLYRYWRNNVDLDDLVGLHPTDLEVIRLAHACSFSRFIRAENEDLKLYISNAHFRQLYKCGWEQAALGAFALWTVKRRIRAMPWFYIAETPQASGALLQRAFPTLAGSAIARNNESRGTAERIKEEDVEHLLRMNSYDHAIYAYALQVQQARLKGSDDVGDFEAFARAA